MLKAIVNLFAKPKPAQARENLLQQQRHNDGVLLVQQNNALQKIIIIATNSNVEKLLGYSNQEMVGQDLRKFLTFYEAFSVNEFTDFLDDGVDFAEVLKKQRYFKMHSKNAGEVPLRLRVVRSISAQNLPSFQLVFNDDLLRDELQKNRDKFRQNLKGNEVFDGITGLLNHNSAIKDIEILSFYAGKRDCDSVMIAFEIENFAALKTLYGVEVADKTIKKLAMIIDSCKRDEDISAAISRNTLLLILPETPQKNTETPILRISEKFSQYLAELNIETKPDLNVKYAKILPEIEPEKQISNLLA